MTFPLRKIVSGGQTGVDRAALDVAIFLDIEHGGWCPRGRRAEDGQIDTIYRLSETAESDYSVRTEQNVIDSDGTLIVCQGPATGGTKLTLRLARSHKRPLLTIDLADPLSLEQQADRVIEWINQNHVQVVNVAGPRESSSPGIGELVEELLVLAFR